MNEEIHKIYNEKWHGKSSLSRAKKILLAIAIFLIVIIATQIWNASKYQMVVNVVEGENKMGVNPLTDKLDFGDLSRNNGMTRYVTLKSGGSVDTYVTIIKLGKISDLVEVSKNSFILNSGQEEKIAFDIKIPPSAQTKEYTGWAVIFRLPKFF